MENSGMRLPGIFCPDENVEQFFKLYGNDNLSNMIMAANYSHPYNSNNVQNNAHHAHPPPGIMQVNPGFQSRFYGNSPAIDERNLKYNSRYVANAFQRSSPTMHRGYGDHYSPSPSFKNYNPEYSPRQLGVQPPRARQYHSEQNQQLQFMYPPPPGPRFPWL
ncbi:uncharacterized protein LOC108101129 [Drosophila ficusphila]|uniref:uncharacterized protein LOC108101129 n=1 Tax=Drosophila ficusphila TaxID=30025 RepID=UPI0007E797F0|nr:uncharacterized protein LOC108101129 [Drosophila ficusphila]